MELTQNIVDRAKAAGFALRSAALYEARNDDQLFVNPNTKNLMVFYRYGAKGVEFLTHSDVAANRI